MINKIAYLGPQNSFSHQAAKQMAKNTQTLVPFRTLGAVIGAVDSCTNAVIPIENSIEGSVNACLDCLAFESAARIISRTVLTIDHRLFVLKGADLRNITAVKTHPQAYAQVSHTLEKMFPNGLSVIFTESTSKAVEELNQNTCAVAGVQNNAEHLCMGTENIADIKNNQTAFAMLSASQPFQPNANRALIVFEAENRAGGLFDMLKILRDHNLSMTFIQSRPHKTELGRYIFFVEFICNPTAQNTQAALAEIEGDSNLFRVLGYYKG